MHYCDALSEMNAHQQCPFCEIDEQFKIYENEYMHLIPARAPYVEDHLLVIPKRHVTLLQELSHEELQSLHALIDKRAKKLHTKHKDVNLLLRDGLVGGASEKSINHLHFHLIPDCPVGAEERSGTDRPFLEADQYVMLTESLKTTYDDIR